VICIDTNFAHECRRGEELHFDASFGHEVVGEGKAGEREEERGGEYRAHCADVRCVVRGDIGVGW
jgi:hypothetical protein